MGLPDQSDQHPLARLVQQAHETHEQAQRAQMELPATQDMPMSPPSDEAGMPWPRPGSLTDPLFQDLDRNSRYYLAHC